MMERVGAAARESRSATPRAAALPLPAQAPAVSRWAAIIVPDPRLSSDMIPERVFGAEGVGMDVIQAPKLET
jgi:hypothetical protein